MSGVTLSSSAGLAIHSRPQAMAVSERPLPSLTDSKEKRMHSPSPMEGARNAKKIKGQSLPPNFALSSSKVPVMEIEAEARMSFILGDITRLV